MSIKQFKNNFFATEYTETTEKIVGRCYATIILCVLCDL